MRSPLLKRETTILYSGLALLVLIVCITMKSPFFDEMLYLRDVEVLHQYGFTRAFLLKLTGSAGPLYAAVHFLLEPVTHLQPPYIRLVNIFFLSGVLFFLERTLSLLDSSRRYYSLYSLAIPMTYLSAGLALTEMPAMFFLTLGMYLILYSIIKCSFLLPQLSYIIAGGICLGVSITGRQPYLLILAALPVLFLDRWGKQNILKLSLLILSSIALPAYIFWVWKGLVPPADAILYKEIAYQGVSYRPAFFFLCLAYFAVIFLIISPDMYRKPGKVTWLLLVAGYFLLAAINFQTRWISYLPLASVAEKVFRSPSVRDKAALFSGAGLVVIACYFLLSLVIQVQKRGYPKYLSFYTIAMILIAVSCSKITWGFSSRYAAQAIPLIIITASYFQQRSAPVYAIIIGVLLGLYSLLSYISIG